MNRRSGFAATASVAHNSSITKAASIRQSRARAPVDFAQGGSAPHQTAQQTDARLGKIVRVLMHFPTVVISGTKLAQEIGTTRSEVWRLVQQLRALGVEITGHPASGYQLTAVPDLLLPEMLEPLLRGTIFGGNIHHYYRAGSTNTLALEAASDGAPEGSIFLAEQLGALASCAASVGCSDALARRRSGGAVGDPGHRLARACGPEVA